MRAVAISAVLVDHLWPGVPRAATTLLGMLGVKLFFVLSGYFIAGILLRGLVEVDREETSGARLLRRFYERRAMRIVPIYYLTLAVAAALDVGDTRASLGWHAAYASNVYVALLGNWPAVTGHFWSLAIEAQFYLVWPLLLVFTPARRRRAVVIAAIALTAVARGVAVSAGVGSHALNVLPIGSLDALAMGSLIGALSTGHPADVRWRRRIGWFSAFVALPTFALLCAAQYLDAGEGVRRVLWPLCAAFVFAGSIGRIADGPSPAARRVLEWKPLVRLGQISYGVYVYHPFVTTGVLALIGATQIHTAGVPLLCAAASIALAEVSWRRIEAPLLARRPRATGPALGRPPVLEGPGSTTHPIGDEDSARPVAASGR